ncbi:MAG: tRNA lysidine(34) synthetase TilS [Kordiimonas sp.]|nr:tRNA lysidine(34) synthetase TilS [Kordiimonas sp.]
MTNTDTIDTDVGKQKHIEPLDQSDFRSLMQLLPNVVRDDPIAVAVSGGADSLALCFLLAEWGRNIVALTVDHGLRPEAAGEARQVADWCAEKNIPHHILTWQGPRPEKAVQATARQMRYQLMGEYCAAQHIKYLAVAHHQDDQAETVLHRLIRGSGVDGLAGMSVIASLPLSTEMPPTIGHGQEMPLMIRPLLSVPKDRLVSMLTAMGQAWISDPSNANTEYDRVKLRRALASGETLMDSAALLQLSVQMSSVKAYLQHEMAKARHDIIRDVLCDSLPMGAVHIDISRLRQCPPEIGQRLLRRLLRDVAGADYPPKRAKVARLYDHVIAGHFSGASLGGCLLINEERTGGVICCREPDNISQTVSLMVGQKGLWDGRFWVGCIEEQGQVSALGVSGLRQWQDVVGDKAAERPVLFFEGDEGRGCEVRPHSVILQTLPALFDDGVLVAAPHLGYNVAGYAMSCSVASRHADIIGAQHDD